MNPDIHEEDWLAWVEGTLPPERRPMIEQALAEDPEWAATLERLRADHLLLSRPLDHAPPAGLAARAMEAAARRLPPPAPLPFWRRQLFWGSAAAAFVGVLGLALWVTHGPQGTQPVALRVPMAPATDSAEAQAEIGAERKRAETLQAKESGWAGATAAAPAPADATSAAGANAFGSAQPAALPKDTLESGRRETEKQRLATGDLAAHKLAASATPAPAVQPQTAPAPGPAALGAAPASAAAPPAPPPGGKAADDGTRRDVGKDLADSAAARASLAGGAIPEKGVASAEDPGRSAGLPLPVTRWQVADVENARASLRSWAALHQCPLPEEATGKFTINLNQEKALQLQAFLRSQGQPDLELANPGILLISP